MEVSAFVHFTYPITYHLFWKDVLQKFGRRLKVLFSDYFSPPLPLTTSGERGSYSDNLIFRFSPPALPNFPSGLPYLTLPFRFLVICSRIQISIHLTPLSPFSSLTLHWRSPFSVPSSLVFLSKINVKHSLAFFSPSSLSYW